MAEEEKRGVLGRLWHGLTRPSASYAAGTLLVIGIVVGILFWGGFNWSMEMTNTQSFCISCHEMKQNPYKEYRGSIHDTNASGVRASCPDCHVPDDWTHKVVRKIKASRELFHKMAGTISTPEKYQEYRLTMAKSVWETMLVTDSRECRNCHEFQSMDLVAQGKRARQMHSRAKEKDMTCIQCHQGVAHKLPKGADKAFKKLEERLGLPQLVKNP